MSRLLLAISCSLFFFGPIPAQNSRVQLEGQVVCCAECWGEKDRTKVEFGTAEDLLKSKSCVEGGDPTLLAVREGDSFKLYQLALGKFRLSGKNWLEFVGKGIGVTGTIQNKKDVNTIRVDSVNVLAPSLAEQQASKLVGQEVTLTLRDLSGVEQAGVAKGSCCRSQLLGHVLHSMPYRDAGSRGNSKRVCSTWCADYRGLD